MKVHFIAIGGAAMHNLAIALHKKGYKVSGSDDEIFEPSRSGLERYGLLPEKTGWDPQKVTPDTDTIILGMHAREDNPELKRAKELQQQQQSGTQQPPKLKIQSFPEFLYDQTRDKTRVVVGGSHGKTTITAMVMHALKTNGIKFDYMAGSRIEGFDTMVGLSDDTELAVFEGDEYLSSALDRRPKFHLYRPHIALLSGIAWDHINVFPTWENYLDQFRKFIDFIEPGGALVWCSEDPELNKLIHSSNLTIDAFPYQTHPFAIRDGATYLINPQVSVPVFGAHNMQNLNGARLICNILGINDERFYRSIQTFPGSKKRLQLLAQNTATSVYLDFAHAPTKVNATTMAMKNQYPERELVAVLELHTYSSLNAGFLQHYKDSMLTPDRAMVYFNPKTIEHKKLPPLTRKQVRDAFGRQDLEVSNSADELMKELREMNWDNKNLVIMTSGNFDGQDLEKLASNIIHTS